MPMANVLKEYGLTCAMTNGAAGISENINRDGAPCRAGASLNIARIGEVADAGFHKYDHLFRKQGRAG